MNRLRPQITGIAVGLSIAIFGGLADARRPPAVAVRWLAAGTGLAFLATHWLQRFDESADFRRRDRRTKLKILNRHLKNQASGQHRVLADKNLEPDTMFGDETIAAHHSTPETFVSNEFVNLSPSESFGDLAADLRRAFDSAVETNQCWQKFEPVRFRTSSNECNLDQFVKMWPNWRKILSKSFPTQKRG